MVYTHIHVTVPIVGIMGDRRETARQRLASRGQCFNAALLDAIQARPWPCAAGCDLWHQRRGKGEGCIRVVN